MGFGCINNLQVACGMGSFGTEFRYPAETTRRLDGPDAATQSISTLIDVKVLPKTMSHGYLAWWHVGIAEVHGGPMAEQSLAQNRQPA